MINQPKFTIENTEINYSKTSIELLLFADIGVFHREFQLIGRRYYSLRLKFVAKGLLSNVMCGLT